MREQEEHPTSDADRYTRGVELYRKGSYDEAVAALKPLASREDLTGRIANFYRGMGYRAIGIRALREGRFGCAERNLKLAVESLGSNSDLSEYLAGILVQAPHREEHLSEMERALGKQSDSAGSWRKLAQAQWYAGRRLQAHMTLNEALRHLSANAELHLQLGLFHAAEERFTEAQESLTRAAECDCTNGEVHYYLGLVAAAQGDVQSAVRLFQRGFLLRPGDSMLAYQLALSAKAAGKTGIQVAIRPLETPTGGAQIRELAEYVGGEPDFIDALLGLPESGADEELFGLLVGVLQTVMVEHSDRADLQLQYARVLQRLGRPDEGIQHARWAVDINPRYVQARLQLARLYAQTDRPEEALEAVQQAIKDGADFPDVHYLTAELMKQTNRTDGARKHLRRALQLNPNYTRAAEALNALAA